MATKGTKEYTLQTKIERALKVIMLDEGCSLLKAQVILRDGVIVGSVAHPNWPSMMSFLQFGKDGDGNFSDNRIDEVLLYVLVIVTGKQIGRAHV